MKKTMLSLLLSLSLLSLAGCEEAAGDSVQETTQPQVEETAEFVYNILEADGFRNHYDMLTGPDDVLQTGKDWTGVYVGSPFQMAQIAEDGTLQSGWKKVYFPLMLDGGVAAYIVLNEDGTCSDIRDSAEELTELLQDGGCAALAADDGGGIYAVSEDDTVTVLSAPYEGEGIMPDASYEEVSTFHNVVTLESMSVEFDGEDSAEVLEWMKAE